MMFCRYREKDSKFPNWIEMAVNPPDSRKIVIHNLLANTNYVFQVTAHNEYGDGMYSEIIEAKTKGEKKRKFLYRVTQSTRPCRGQALLGRIGNGLLGVPLGGPLVI